MSTLAVKGSGLKERNSKGKLCSFRDTLFTKGKERMEREGEKEGEIIIEEIEIKIQNGESD